MCDNSEDTKVIKTKKRKRKYDYRKKKKTFDIYVELYLLNIFVKFLGKVTRNRKDKGKRRSPIYKHTVTQVLLFTFRF